mmetsp:Transcript_12015/g.48358  ORF Transcript_12015/g.48358 Transcript_12015/m.48358 type:complete len:207 (+) Transcript_12015:2031-2651(+)
MAIHSTRSATDPCFSATMLVILTYVATYEVVSTLPPMSQNTVAPKMSSNGYLFTKALFFCTLLVLLSALRRFLSVAATASRGGRRSTICSGSTGDANRAAALRTAIVASVAYCAKSLPVTSSMSGTKAPAMAKETVLAPSQGPAWTPWTLRVMIWHPVSRVAVHVPSANHVRCSTQVDRTKGMTSKMAASATRTATMTRLPRRGGA